MQMGKAPRQPGRMLAGAGTDLQQGARGLTMLLQHGKDRGLVVFSGLRVGALGHYFLFMNFWPITIRRW